MRELNGKLRTEFDVKFPIPVVFIDPVLKVFHPPGKRERQKLEQREVDIFNNQTLQLWNLAKKMKPYKCSENCQAPDDFYLGKPWIQADNKAMEEGGINTLIPCKIWDGIVSSREKNSDIIRWYFNDELLFMKEKNNPNPYISPRALALYGIRIEPPQKGPGSFFAVS